MNSRRSYFIGDDKMRMRMKKIPSITSRTLNLKPAVRPGAHLPGVVESLQKQLPSGFT
jgi:hypothetical protein